MDVSNPTATGTLQPVATTGELAPFDLKTATFVSAASPKRKRSRPLIHLADRVFGRVLMITQQKLEIILGVIGEDIGLAAEAIPIIVDPQTRGDGDEDPGYSMRSGIAVIPVHGTLVSRASGMDALSGLCSYDELKSQYAAAMADPNVKGIVLDVDSPGGECSSLFELADYLSSNRSKPVYAVCADQMCSAAYAIGSCADLIYTSRTGMCGSIGCYMLHTDQSGMDKQRGLRYTYIQAGDKKTEGNPHEPLDKDARAMMQNEVNRIRDMFVTMVAMNRGVTAQQVIDTQAGVFFGENAVPLLADKLGTLDDAIEDMQAKLGINPETDDEDEDCDPTDPDGDCYDPEAKAKAAFSLSQGVYELPANVGAITVSGIPQEVTSNAYKFTLKQVPTARDFGPANVKALRSAIRSLRGARGGSAIPAAERKAAYEEIAKQLKKAGVEVPPLNSQGVYEYALAEANSALRLQLDGIWDFSPGNSVPSFAVSVLWNEDLQSASSYVLKTGGPLAVAILEGLRPLVTGDYPEAIAAVRMFPENLASVTETGNNSRRISMLVVPYDGAQANLGGFKEIYQRGCFAEGLDNDPRALFNHDEACVLGRKSAGTAKFWEDAAGVHCEADAPETTWASDLITSMRRGDITQASAAFWILQHHWEMRGGEKVRVIEKALLREASVHAFAAYETTRATVQPAPVSVAAHAEVELYGARLRLLKAR